MSNPLKDAAMLVKLTRRKPNANCQDRKQSTDLQERLSVKMKNGVRVMKSLFSKEFSNPYTKIQNEAAKYYYKVTLPWYDDGFRLLPSAMFDEFSEKFRKFNTKLDWAVRTACEKYEDEINRAEIELGDAFNRKDYLSVEEFKGKFVLKLDYGVVTDGDDFRTDLSAHQKQAVVDQMNNEHERRVRESNEFMFHRLYDVIADLAETMADPNQVYRDTKVSNVIELCEMLPLMNVHEDANLEKLANGILEKVSAIDPDTCRKDLQERAKAANVARKATKEVKDVMDSMDGYF